MVLIAFDQIADDILMMGEGLDSMFRIEGLDLLAVEVRTAAKVKVDADCRRLINHDEAFFIAKTHHLFTVRIVAGTEGVGSLPLHNGQILDIHGNIHTAAGRESILMFSISLEVEGTAVDQEADAIHFYGTNSIGKFIDIFAGGYFYGVEIGVHRLPQSDVRQTDFALGSFCRGNDIAFMIQNGHSNRCFSSGNVHLIGKNSLHLISQRIFYICCHRHIFYISPGRRIDADRTGDSTVIEKVKVRIILFFLVLIILSGYRAAAQHAALAAHRKRGIVDHIVDSDGQKIIAVLKDFSYLGLKWQKTAEVFADLLSVQENLCVMRYGIKTKDDPLIFPDLFGYRNMALIEDPSIMIAEGNAFFQIVIGSRYRHRDRIFKCFLLPSIAKPGSVIKFKTPDPAKVHYQSGICQNRIQHERFPSLSLLSIRRAMAGGYRTTIPSSSAAIGITSMKSVTQSASGTPVQQNKV